MGLHLLKPRPLFSRFSLRMGLARRDPWQHRAAAEAACHAWSQHPRRPQLPVAGQPSMPWQRCLPGRGGQARHRSTPQKSPTLPQQSSSLVSPGRGLVHCRERSRRSGVSLQAGVGTERPSRLAGKQGQGSGSAAGTVLAAQLPAGPGMQFKTVNSSADRKTHSSPSCTPRRGRGHPVEQNTHQR